ncbi:hypothetical protein PR048_025342 [Dryococelus australis]|uniref:Uncharacterized protein n=1 Tax=Dryococelus australis TaxID=614101 RepID=A0ABQ9GR22_9NEOP|nr:hypothetical protein PR048_025342 [Dryococelus australis]
MANVILHDVEGTGGNRSLAGVPEVLSLYQCLLTGLSSASTYLMLSRRVVFSELPCPPRSLYLATCTQTHNQSIRIHGTVIIAVHGATVTERLVCSPPTKATWAQSPAGSLRVFACENRAGRCRWLAGFLGVIPFPPPLYSGTAPRLASPSAHRHRDKLQAMKMDGGRIAFFNQPPNVKVFNCVMAFKFRKQHQVNEAGERGNDSLNATDRVCGGGGSAPGIAIVSRRDERGIRHSSWDLRIARAQPASCDRVIRSTTVGRTARCLAHVARRLNVRPSQNRPGMAKHLCTESGITWSGVHSDQVPSPLPCPYRTARRKNVTHSGRRRARTLVPCVCSAVRSGQQQKLLDVEGCRLFTTLTANAIARESSGCQTVNDYRAANNTKHKKPVPRMTGQSFKTGEAVNGERRHFLRVWERAGHENEGGAGGCDKKQLMGWTRSRTTHTHTHAAQPGGRSGPWETGNKLLLARALPSHLATAQVGERDKEHEEKEDGTCDQWSNRPKKQEEGRGCVPGSTRSSPQATKD